MASCDDNLHVWVQIKQELEAGATLKPVLLTKALYSLALFAKATGMLTHLAPHLLPLCTFTAQAVNMPEHLMLTNVQRLGMEHLVYSPDQLLAAQAAVTSPSQAQVGHHLGSQVDFASN